MNRVLAVTTTAWLTLAGCGSAAPAVTEPPVLGPAAYKPPAPLVVSNPYFRPGEQMTWSLSLRGIFGGEATLLVGEPALVDGRNIIAIHSQTATAGAVKLLKEVRDDVTTWIDLDSCLPIRLAAELKFGAKEIQIETTFTATGYQSSYQRLTPPNPRSVKRSSPHGQPNDQPVRHLRQVVPAAFTYETHSLIGVLRNWDPEPGTRAYFYAVAGRRLWHNSIRFVGRELYRTGLGLSPALRFEGVATRVNGRLQVEKQKKPRAYTVWFSDDARRVPLMVIAHTEYGEVTVELTDYQPGTMVSAR